MRPIRDLLPRRATLLTVALSTLLGGSVAIGVVALYVVAGRARGSAGIARVLGPRPLVASFYQDHRARGRYAIDADLRERLRNSADLNPAADAAFEAITSLESAVAALDGRVDALEGPKGRPGPAAAPVPVVGPVSTLVVAVRPTDLDSKGHVGNARYLEYLQAARWRWLEDRGLSDESLRAAGAVLVVVRAEIDYRAEIRYGDEIRVETWALSEGPKKAVFGQRIVRKGNVVAAEAKVIMVAIDPVARGSRPLPDALMKRLGPQ